MIVLIDVSLSHTFLSSSSTFFLFRLLGVNFLAHTHPLHECSKYRKGVDQFDLYLASGMGTNPDKTPQQTKSFLSRIPNPPSWTQTPLETFESWTARALAPFVLMLLVSMLI